MITSTAAVREFILTSILHQRNIDLSDTEPLIKNGYLTSLDVVELVMFLEDRFGIEIDADDVTEEHFATLRAIADLVERSGAHVA